jgi:lipid-binding SYLF domain-containing protein
MLSSKGELMRTRRIVNMVALAAAALGACAAVSAKDTSLGERQQAAADDRRLVGDAAVMVKKMRHDRKLTRLLARAKGVVLIPHYGKAGIGIGGAGGEGLLLVHRENDWYGPAFYSIGGISLGIQLGIAGGPVAMLLMNDKTVKQFETRPSKWSMRTAAGLTVVKYDGEAENASRDGDVVVWSALKGLYGGVALGASNISVDKDGNSGYYHHDYTPRQIVAGTARLSHSQPLHAALEGAALKVAKRDDTPKPKPQEAAKPDDKAKGK